jgi:hypothetical protein
MDGWDIFVFALAVLGAFTVAMKAFFDLRLRKIERVRDTLMDAARWGEVISAAERLDMTSCQQWMSHASSVVERRLVKSVAASFAETTRDIMVGVEAIGDRGSAPASDNVTRMANAAAREGLREGVAWLRRRAGLLGPRDVRGRFWRFRM